MSETNFKEGERVALITTHRIGPEHVLPRLVHKVHKNGNFTLLNVLGKVWRSTGYLAGANKGYVGYSQHVERWSDEHARNFEAQKARQQREARLRVVREKMAKLEAVTIDDATLEALELALATPRLRGQSEPQE